MKTKLLSIIVIALSATAAAHAGNVSWGVSIGGHGGGISVGVGAGHHGHHGHYARHGYHRHHRHHHGFQVAVPVVVTRAPAVVYAPPHHVVMAAPVCAPAPVYVAAPGPVFVAPPPVFAPRFGFRAHW
jgi:hypothetical protein